jgi:hypothetical protein
MAGTCKALSNYLPKINTAAGEERREVESNISLGMSGVLQDFVWLVESKHIGVNLRSGKEFEDFRQNLYNLVLAVNHDLGDITITRTVKEPDET